MNGCMLSDIQTRPKAKGCVSDRTRSDGHSHGHVNAVRVTGF